jgi:hypothetical protein
MRILATLIAVPALAIAAFGADQTVLGRSMAVSDPLPGVNPSKRIVKVTASESRDTDNSVVGDPIADGATFQVIVNGGTSSNQTFTLPAGPHSTSTSPGWTGKVVPGSYAAYIYKDKNGEASPLIALKLTWRAGRYFRLTAKADAKGNNGPLNVVPGNPTSDLGIRLTLGTGDTYCVLFGGAAGGVIIDKADGTLTKAGKVTGQGCPVAP